MREVARAAGVSVATVSNVMNNPAVVAAQTRLRVEEAMLEVGFVPNVAARWLRGIPSSMVGAVTLDVSNTFFAEITRGMEDALTDGGCVLMTCSTDVNPAKEAHHLRVLEQHGVRGVIITPVSESLDALVRLTERGTPVVLVDHPRDGEDLCAVTVDNVAGGQLAAAHLIELGHRRIGFLCGSVDVRSLSDRRRGIVTAMRAAGLDPGSDLVEFPITPPRILEGAQAITESILGMPEPPTGIICFNDTAALGLLRGLQQAGVAVPEAMSVVGYDDISFAANLWPPLTTVRQPSYQLGRMAADLLLDEGRREHRHDELMFRPTLVVRASTARPNRQGRTPRG